MALNGAASLVTVACTTDRDPCARRGWERTHARLFVPGPGATAAEGVDVFPGADEAWEDVASPQALRAAVLAALPLPSSAVVDHLEGLVAAGRRVLAGEPLLLYARSGTSQDTQATDAVAKTLRIPGVIVRLIDCGLPTSLCAQLRLNTVLPLCCCVSPQPSHLVTPPSPPPPSHCVCRYLRSPFSLERDTASITAACMLGH